MRLLRPDCPQSWLVGTARCAVTARRAGGIFAIVRSTTFVAPLNAPTTKHFTAYFPALQPPSIIIVLPVTMALSSAAK
jgi:hypothetical protein